MNSPVEDFVNTDLASLSEESLAKGLAIELTTDADNERRRWPLKFLKEYLESGRYSLKSLELAIRATPDPTRLQALLFATYAGHLRKDCAKAVDQLRSMLDGIQLLALHISCEPRLDLARASVETFAESGQLRNLIVIGHGDGDPHYHFDAERRILSVPAPDIYEGLSQKVAAAYRFLGFAANKISILKIDDDIRAVPTRFDAGHIATLAEMHDYLGFVIDTRLTGMHRWWHFGKCTDQSLNETPYSLAHHASYVRGPAYALSWKAISALAKGSIYYCGQFDIEGGYEDLAVGKVLNAFGIHPTNYDLERHGFVYSADSVRQQ